MTVTDVTDFGRLLVGGCAFVGDGVVQSRGDSFEVFDPASGEVPGVVPSARATEVHQATLAGKAARAVWAQLPAPERGRYLRRMAQVVAEHREELAQIVTAAPR
jgi:acyl-CoA reductase-like NAD-dependent aldehyde dehydrogenase